VSSLKMRRVEAAIVAVIALQHAKDERFPGVVLYKGNTSVSSKLRFLRLLLDRSDDPVVVDYLTDMRVIAARLQIVNDTATLWDRLETETKYVEARTLVRECLQ